MVLAQSSLHVEIQSLKDALAASENKADKYAQLNATLTVELNNLRNAICDSCKKKLASSNVLVPPMTISAGQGSACTTELTSASLGRRMFQGYQRSRPNSSPIRPFHLLAASPDTNTPLPFPSDIAPNLGSSPTTFAPTYAGLNGDLIPEEKYTPPRWSVVYHPEAERALNLHLAHEFTYKGSANCVKMSPDGQRLAVGGDGPTYLYELETGSNICVFVDRYAKDDIEIWSIEFSADGQLLATGANDDQIRIWDISTRRMRAMLKGHTFPICEVAFSPNGRSLVSASDDRSVRIWSVRDGSSNVLPVIGSPNSFMSAAFSPDGRYVVAGNWDSSLWIWDSRTHRLVAMWRDHTNGVLCTVFTADGKGLMSGDSDNTVKHWDVSSLGHRQGASTGMVVNNEQGFPEVRSFLGHSGLNPCLATQGGVYSVALFPDNGRWIVAGSCDRSVRVWDTESGVCLLTLQGHMDRVLEVDVSQNFLATAGEDGYLAVWKYKLL